MQELLDKWNIRIDYNVLLSMWNESHRHYHNQNHLLDLISQINEGKSQFESQKDYEKMLLCALFHDCVYDPTRNDNEEKSAEFFESCCGDKSNRDIQQIKQMILDTKGHESSSHLSEKFNQLDMNICERDFEQLLRWEDGIYEEFKIYGDAAYKVGRVNFLESLLDKYPNNTHNLLKLIDWVKTNY